MNATIPRRGAALLLAVTLLAAATPLAAAPHGPPEESPRGPSFVESLTDWVVGLVAGPAPAETRVSLEAGADDEPEDDGLVDATSEDPAEPPELGSVIDPNG